MDIEARSNQAQRTTVEARSNHSMEHGTKGFKGTRSESTEYPSMTDSDRELAKVSGNRSIKFSLRTK